jgi:hypothetical protein
MDWTRKPKISFFGIGGALHFRWMLSVVLGRRRTAIPPFPTATVQLLQTTSAGERIHPRPGAAGEQNGHGFIKLDPQEESTQRPMNRSHGAQVKRFPSQNAQNSEGSVNMDLLRSIERHLGRLSMWEGHARQAATLTSVLQRFRHRQRSVYSFTKTVHGDDLIASIDC